MSPYCGDDEGLGGLLGEDGDVVNYSSSSGGISYSYTYTCTDNTDVDMTDEQKSDHVVFCNERLRFIVNGILLHKFLAVVLGVLAVCFCTFAIMEYSEVSFCFFLGMLYFFLDNFKDIRIKSLSLEEKTLELDNFIIIHAPKNSLAVFNKVRL
jgi:hypothetical protein